VPDLGWVAAKDLQAGSYLQTKYESWLDVDNVVKRSDTATVYNFEVAGFHTYFVSDLGLLVHNVCGGDGKIQFPQGAWIARDTYNDLPKLAGKDNAKKFTSALKKSIDIGTVGSKNEAGIKILGGDVLGYTHELKINGSAARILGKYDANGVMVFDLYLPNGLHSSKYK
jgi:Pretoxin HINT domain